MGDVLVPLFNSIFDCFTSVRSHFDEYSLSAYVINILLFWLNLVYWI